MINKKQLFHEMLGGERSQPVRSDHPIDFEVSLD